MSLGPAEILVVLVVALVLFGPKRLPEVSRQVGGALRELRKIQDTVQNEMRSVMDEHVGPITHEPPLAEPLPPALNAGEPALDAGEPDVGDEHTRPAEVVDVTPETTPVPAPDHLERHLEQHPEQDPEHPGIDGLSGGSFS
jgi:sec-independent protein translocase protein TatA